VPLYGLARIYKIEGRFKKRPNYAWEFFESSLLRRLITTYSGVFSLFISSLIIFIVIAFFAKDQYISKEEINKYGIYPSPLAELFGFHPGDKVLKINGKDFYRYDELINPATFETAGNSYTVLRQNEELVIEITALDFEAHTSEPFLRIMAPFEIESVVRNSPAADIELQRGDRIVKVNERQIRSFPDMQEAFRNETDDHALVEIQRLENGDTTILVKEVRLDPQKRIGVFTRESIQYTVKPNSFFCAFFVGIRNTFSSLIAHVNASFMIPESKSSKRGSIAISSVFGEFSWLRFWYITAGLSTGLMIWNFLPYPKSALWESVALAYERVSRKKYTHSFFNKTLSIGWFIIFVRILWVLVNDFAKLF
jgi:regulator of sigma E protease